MSIINVENLTKTFKVTQKQPGVGGAFKALFKPDYKIVTAINRISFSVDQGEAIGYIGVNGSGKSTTIKVLTGILEPSGGNVEVFGRNPFRYRVKNAKEIGVVFGQRSQLWWDIPMIDSLRLLADIYQIEPECFKKQLKRLTDMLELDELLYKPVRSMSLGQKMRSELTASLLHNPKILFLDEPTIGLDIMAKERIRSFISQLNQDYRTTIILTTHDFDDIQKLCKRVIIIDAGSIVFEGLLTDIKEKYGRNRIIRFQTSGSQYELRIPDGANLLSRERNQLTLSFDRTKTTASKISASILSQTEVLDFVIEEPELGGIVKQIYKELKKGDDAYEKISLQAGAIK
jgi:ABC-2 type transport system ATP-binding protein